MKIGLVIDCLDPRRGGAEQWTLQHAERLLARGHEVHVVAQDIAGRAAQLPIVAHRLGRFRSILARAEAAESKLRGLGLDVIHDIGLGWYSHLLQSEDGSRIAQWQQKLLLLPPWLRPAKRALLHTLPRYRHFRQLMARQFGDPARIVVAISKMCARDYQQYHHVDPARIRLIYHGTDTERFSPLHRDRWRGRVRTRLGIGPHEVLFLFVGHDYHRKGLATAVRAIARLAAEGCPVRLLVVGGKRRRGLPHLSPQQRAAVRFVGAADDPMPYYAAADAVVLPSFYDPFGLVVLEGAACALPVVTTRSTGASELLTDGLDGYVLPDPTDDRELAGRLRELLDPLLRGRMGQAARTLALKHGLDRNCDQIIDIYREIAGARRRAA
ncbi:MAG: glycosyltransferase family 4 protein [Thermoguttaceae bacterium]|jgi:UDP-glucose:(heptosyl)LPS alpha-1,3-glucosyltransferase